jgi:large subunit ribosomal protein L7/L12
LASFDAAKKINLIKEIRAMLNLGLKEAKELVERAPVLIRPGTPRADAEEIKKKLEDIGAKVDLI